MRQAALRQRRRGHDGGFHAALPLDGDRPTILYPEDLPITPDSLKPTPLSAVDARADATTARSPSPVDLVMAGNVQPADFGFDPGIGSNDWVATGR